MDMNLDNNINYIVSGLERSGTSLMMQILRSAGIPTAYDDVRKPDDNNPRGYFELEGGKIIKSLMSNSFPIKRYTGRFIKITAYGINYLPFGNYKIIYMERDIDEVVSSMSKMVGKKFTQRDKTRFIKLNKAIKEELDSLIHVNYIIINYNELMDKPRENLEKIMDFLELSDIDINKMLSVIDDKLYRERKL